MDYNNQEEVKKYIEEMRIKNAYLLELRKGQLEAERQRKLHEKLLQEAADKRRSKIFRKELDRFADKLEDRKAARQKSLQKYLAEKKDFADAAQLLEEAEARKQAQLEREQKRRQEEKERLLRQKQLEEQRKEQERLRLEEEARQALLAREEAARQALLAQVRERLQPYCEELGQFMGALEQRKEERAAYQQKLKNDKRQFEEQRQKMLAARRAEQ